MAIGAGTYGHTVHQQPAPRCPRHHPPIASRRRSRLCRSQPGNPRRRRGGTHLPPACPALTPAWSWSPHRDGLGPARHPSGWSGRFPDTVGLPVNTPALPADRGGALPSGIEHCSNQSCGSMLSTSVLASGASRTAASELARHQRRRERGEAEDRRPERDVRPVRQPRPKGATRGQPPVPVESATWLPAGELDYLVRDRFEWWVRVRGPDGQPVWIKAADLRQVKDDE
jgi:hypothetical protein